MHWSSGRCAFGARIGASMGVGSGLAHYFALLLFALVWKIRDIVCLAGGYRYIVSLVSRQDKRKRAHLLSHKPAMIVHRL